MPTMIDCIAIPTTERENGDLAVLFACWSLFHAGSKISSRLIITFPKNSNQKVENETRNLIKIFSVDSLFNSVDIEFLSIPDEEDIYIKHGTVWEGPIPRLGFKSGPNLQFFRTLKIAHDSRFTFLNETDVLPLDPLWITRLSETLRERHDWVLGSHYKGDTVLAPDIIGHINGAAVYSTGSKRFQEFCELHWEPGVEKMCKDFPDTAYDIWLTRMQHQISIKPHIWKGADNRSRQAILEALSRFATTDVIANLTLPSDYRPIQTLREQGFSLAHGKHFSFPALEYAVNWASKHAGIKLSRAQYLAIASRCKNNPKLVLALQSYMPDSAVSLAKRIVANSIKKEELLQASQVTPDPLIPIKYAGETHHAELLESILNSELMSQGDKDIWPLVAKQDWTFDFLIHHGIYQHSVFNYGVLTGNKLLYDSNEIRHNSKTSFYHVLSIFIFTPDYTPPRLYQDRLHGEISNNHEPSSFSCNLLRSTDSEQNHSTWLHIVSGKTHESCLIDLGSNHACFTYNPNARPVSPHLEELVRLSLKQLRVTLENKSSSYYQWKAEPKFRHAFCPVTTRPFLAINDYMIAISSSINSNPLNKVALFDIGYKTFLDYSKVIFQSASYEGYIDFISLDEANKWLLDDISWFHVPTSLESNQSHWQALIQTASSFDAAEMLVNSHLVELTEILQCDPSLVAYSLDKSDINLSGLVNERFIILLDLAVEKRSWLDQLAAFKSIIEHQRLRSKDILVCIDGSTKWILEGRLEDHRLTTKVGKSYRELIKSLDTTLSNVIVLPIFGLDYLTKCYFYSRTDYFVAQLGTASIGPSKVFNRFGRLIGPRTIMESPFSSLYSSNARLTDPSLIVNELNGCEPLSWDMTSYRITGYDFLIDHDLKRAAAEW